MNKTPIQLSDHFTYPRLLRFVAPSIVMMIFTSIYYVVDGFFVSNYVGKTPFAALNFIMPFIMVLSGTGFMLGTGGSALVAKELAAGHRERANRFHDDDRLVVVVGLVLTVLGTRSPSHRPPGWAQAESIMRTACSTAASTSRSQPRSCCKTYSKASSSWPSGRAWACWSSSRRAWRTWCSTRCSSRFSTGGWRGAALATGIGPVHRRRHSHGLHPPREGSAAALRSLQV